MRPWNCAFAQMRAGHRGGDCPGSDECVLLLMDRITQVLRDGRVDARRRLL